MEKQEKAFILNKGLILGLVLIFFPIIDLFYGLDMNWINYILIFGLLWIVIYSYLVVKWSKEFASYYEIFPFKDAFRTLFLISAVAFGVLTVGKIVLWNIYAPEKYIEINLRNPQTQYNLALKEISNDDRDCNYDSLSLFEDRNCLIIYGCQDSLIVNVDSTNKIEIISKLIVAFFIIALLIIIDPLIALYSILGVGFTYFLIYFDDLNLNDCMKRN